MATSTVGIHTAREAISFAQSEFNNFMQEAVSKGEEILEILRGSGFSKTKKLTEILAGAREVKRMIVNERGLTSKLTRDYYKLIDSDLKKMSIRDIYIHYHLIHIRQYEDLERLKLLAAYHYAYMALTDKEIRNIRKTMSRRRTPEEENGRHTPNVFGVRNSPNSRSSRSTRRNSHRTNS